MQNRPADLAARGTVTKSMAVQIRCMAHLDIHGTRETDASLRAPCKRSTAARHIMLREEAKYQCKDVRATSTRIGTVIVTTKLIVAILSATETNDATVTVGMTTPMTGDTVGTATTMTVGMADMAGMTTGTLARHDILIQVETIAQNMRTTATAPATARGTHVSVRDTTATREIVRGMKTSGTDLRAATVIEMAVKDRAHDHGLLSGYTLSTILYDQTGNGEGTVHHITAKIVNTGETIDETIRFAWTIGASIALVGHPVMSTEMRRPVPTSTTSREHLGTHLGSLLAMSR